MTHIPFQRKPLAAFVSLFAAFGTSAAQAQTSANAPSTLLQLGEVVITSSSGALSPRQVLTSVNILGSERFENQSAYSNYELLRQVPGLQAGEYLGKGVGYGTLSMRGFNGEGVLNAVKLLIDGVPSNANDGNTYYLDLVPRLDMEAVEIVKGTNDARYGLHNIAGNANVVTRQGGNYTEGRVSAGSFGSTNLQLAKGMESESWTQNLAFGTQHTAGYRDHSSATATNVSGKWFLKLPDGRVGLIVRHLENSALEPGYLSAAQYASNPWQMAPNSANDHDVRRTTQVAVQAEKAIDSQLHLNGQIYRNQLFDQRYIRFPDSSRQERRLLDETHVGASANATYRMGATALGDTVLIAGVDTERQNNLNVRNRPVTTTAANVVRRDHQYVFNTLGGFVQAVIKPTPQWTFTPAYRVDRVTGQATINPDATAGSTPPGTYGVNDNGWIKQPKLSVAYVGTSALTAYANAGRTFQVGTSKAAYQTTAFKALPSVNDGWETGFKFRPHNWLDGRFAVWRQTASSESRTLLGNPANDTVNLGTTRRHGVDLELNARPAKNLNCWGGASAQRAVISSTGREVDHVPHLLYTAGFEHRPVASTKWGAALTGQSSYFIDTTGPEKTGAHTLINLFASHRLSPLVEVDVQVKNLTNRRYAYSYDNSGGLNYYAPNAPRGVYAGLNVKL